MAQIELQHVSYVYSPRTPFEKTALSDVNLEITKGSFTGVIGHTGSGKSTLMKLLNGLLQPTRGKVLFEGTSIWEKKYDRQQLRFRVGLAFQYPEHQLFAETVEQDIAFGLINQQVPEAQQKERIQQALAFTGLSAEYLPKSPFQLSGGEMRRVALAGIIALQPEVLVLDEPTAGLDPAGRKAILEAITAYQKATQTTILFVSHSMDEVAAYADQLVALEDGKILLNGETREVFAQAELLEAAGLAVPQATQVLLELRKKGYNVSPGALTVEETAQLLRKYGEERGLLRGN